MMTNRATMVMTCLKSGELCLQLRLLFQPSVCALTSKTSELSRMLLWRMSCLLETKYGAWQRDDVIKTLEYYCVMTVTEGNLVWRSFFPTLGWFTVLKYVNNATLQRRFHLKVFWFVLFEILFKAGPCVQCVPWRTISWTDRFMVPMWYSSLSLLHPELALLALISQCHPSQGLAFRGE